MTVGIVTMFHKSSNYGGVLQAYALTKVLANYGIEAEQIRYNNFSAFSFVRRMKNNLYRAVMMVKYCKSLRCYLQIRKRKRTVVKAAMQLVPHSRRIYREKTIGKCLCDYSVYISGSDQVWHGEWPAYFLSFVPGGKRKIAYGVSTGKDRLSEYDIEQIKGYTKDYTAISVREADTADILKAAMPNKSIDVVLDPTMLLDLEDWNSIVSERKIKGKYLFCYFLGSDIRIRKLAEKYGEDHGLKIVTIPHMQGIVEPSDMGFGDVQAYDAVPQDFLSYIKYANTVFTDSFHACVFSHIFQRQYYVFGRSERREMNNRIEMLTALFHTQDHYIYENGDFTITHINKIDTINYAQKFDDFKGMKEKSRLFLMNAVIN
ncbi:MAG: polysaccharide pyruvyl transferase family protein [Hungatella sp.]|nr:polysaccharide pyruvyl transferase family protein [Hungatella sp.]